MGAGVVALGVHHLAQLPEILDTNEDKISPAEKMGFLDLHEQLKVLTKQVEHYDNEIGKNEVL